MRIRPEILDYRISKARTEVDSRSTIQAYYTEYYDKTDVK